MLKTHGSIIIKGDKGKIERVYIEPGLERIYQKLFNNSARNIRRNPKKYEQGIKVIILGALYIESLINISLKNVLYIEIKKKDFANALWEKMKRIKTQDKLFLLSKIMKLDQKNQKKIINNTQTIFDLRNRLVHYKDEDEDYYSYISTLDDKTGIDEEKFLKSFKRLPEPSLMLEITEEKILKHIEKIRHIINALKNKVIKYYPF